MTKHTPTTRSLDIIKYISIPGKGIESHLVEVTGKIGTIPHKNIINALECHDELVEALRFATEALKNEYPESEWHHYPAISKAEKILERIKS